MINPSTEAVWSGLSSDLWKFIRKRVADDHTADDLLQETFVRIHRGLTNMAKLESLAAWVYSIARNLVRDHYRRTGNGTFVEPETERVQEDKSQGCQRCGPDVWMQELIQQLPETYREAIQLSEIDGLAQREVAIRLGLSLSGAKSRIQRGRVMLKDLLHECCTFDFDRRGNVIDYEPKPDRTSCLDCG
jgi:RNA polymerase sigma-70 factor, ECF subfamily